jgi:hypothetical protein
MRLSKHTLSQKYRKKIEQGLVESIGGSVRSRLVGRWKWWQLMEITAAAFNLLRLRTRRPA